MQILDCFTVLACCRLCHDDVIKWTLFRVTGRLWGEFTGDRWIPLTKASDAELWCFFWYGTNGWANHRDDGDLSRHRVRYDVTLMVIDRSIYSSHPMHYGLTWPVDILIVFQRSLTIPLQRAVQGDWGIVYTSTSPCVTSVHPRTV